MSDKDIVESSTVVNFLISNFLFLGEINYTILHFKCTALLIMLHCSFLRN